MLDSSISRSSTGLCRCPGESAESLGSGKDAPVVIVVDNDIDNLILLTYVLERFNCLLFCETDGEAAIALINRLKPSLIVLGIRLPRLSGLRLIRALRLNESTRNIPVIAVTALVTLQLKREILQSGGCHYISKPYMLEDMARLVASYLLPILDTTGSAESNWLASPKAFEGS